MPRSPAERLSALAEHARLGWQHLQEDPAFREQTEIWLDAHPSGWREVDELWRDCLLDKGPLADWLASGEDPSEWRGFPSLHSVLASNPFPNLLSSG